MGFHNVLLPLILPACRGETALDLYVLRHSTEVGDANQVAAGRSWGNGIKWIVIKDTADLVTKVKDRCGTSRYIRMLRIGGHGNRRGFEVGDDWITGTTIPSYETRLREISPYLRPEKSVVYLDHCNVGHADRLMNELSRILGGVTVIGPAEFQYTDTGQPQFEGPAKICDPVTCKITHTPNMPLEKLLEFLKHGR